MFAPNFIASASDHSDLSMRAFRASCMETSFMYSVPQSVW